MPLFLSTNPTLTLPSSHPPLQAMEKAEKEVETIHVIDLNSQTYTISKKSRVNDLKEVRERGRVLLTS